MLDHELHPRVAEESVQGGSADHGAVLDERVGVAVEEGIQLCMNHNGRAILVRVIGELDQQSATRASARRAPTSPRTPSSGMRGI